MEGGVVLSNTLEIHNDGLGSTRNRFVYTELTEWHCSKGQLVLAYVLVITYNVNKSVIRFHLDLNFAMN